MNLFHVNNEELVNQLHAHLSRLEPSLLAVDIETTGLSPFRDRVRLVTIADEDQNVWLCDAFQADLRPLMGPLARHTVLGHNLQFDVSFLAQLGFVPGLLRDTLLMSQVVYAGMRNEKNQRLSHSLGAVADRELRQELPKDLQTSDWSVALTEDQYRYAAHDAVVLFPIYCRLLLKIHTYHLDIAADIEFRALPAITWMYLTGVPLNRTKWEALAEEAGRQVDVLEGNLNHQVQWAVDELGVFGNVDRTKLMNWGSPTQFMRLLNELGYPVKSTRDSELVLIQHPIAQVMLAYREQTKLFQTYGKGWLKDLEVDGWLHPRWLQCTTNTGRMACTNPNCQQIPKDKRYRECIEAPPGYKLVMADYSAIELRLACKIAGEAVMMKAFQDGEDLHIVTAKRILDKTEVTRDDRQIAKGVGFGLLYGAGSTTLRRYVKTAYGIDISDEEAVKFRNMFFKVYPGLRRWHKTAGKDTINTRTLSGRWRCNVDKYTEQLNSPTQGSGCDGLKMALALLWERRAECPTAAPILAAHDEICCLVPEADAEKAAEWLRDCMMKGMAWLLAPVPCEVEMAIGQSWGSKG